MLWLRAACVFLVVVLVMAGGLVVLAVALSMRGTRRRQSGKSEERSWQRSARIGAPPTALRWCPECGAGLPEDAPEGLCPQCLLKGAISSARDKADSDPAPQTAAYAGPSVPPIETLAGLLPQLEILELIGQGGMGAVYKARQVSLDRLVALKVLPPEAGRDPAFAERFNREARALARLSHPNIVAVHEIGHVGEFYYIVMEYIDGVNLRQLMRAGHLQPEQALRIVPQICDALQFAHDEGVVHRDIKPENILLDKKGRVKIADFGLAKLLGRDTDNWTLTGSRQVMGTLYYMAPEQVERPLEVDHRADIYSLGVIFYEMLTGQLPVGRFPMPSEKSGTDPHLDGIVLHALEREPERRYQHASDVKTDVEGTTHRSPSLVREPNLADRELALHQVKGPANGLMIMAVLGPVEWLVLYVFYIAEFYLRSRQYRDGDSMFWTGLKQDPTFVILFALNAAVGAFLIVGARMMKRLEAYEFSVITSLMVLLQFATPTFLFSFAVGAWALWILRKPEVKAAFIDNLKRSAPTRRGALFTAPQGQETQASIKWPRARTHGPGQCLLLVGIIYTAIGTIGSLFAAGAFSTGHADSRGVWLTVLMWVALLVQGPIMIMGALKMRRLESYGWAVAGSVLALVPTSPFVVLGLPVGIWALAVLTSPDVKAAFVENAARTASTDSRLT
jgi:tRNA A-37 threonylcarbamoyl transferase component Bud32